MRTHLTLRLAAAALAASMTLPAGAETLDERLERATTVLTELRNIPEGAIPPALLDRAHAIAIVPDMVKIGIGIAGRHGRGVLTVRQGAGWSAPVFIKLSGGSIGLQAGLQSSDVVLVFTNERGVQNIADGKLTLGADATVAAGPVGRNASAATDGRLQAEVYSWSRARGLFAGVALDGARLRIDDRANAAYYVAPGITAGTILDGIGDRLPDSAVRFSRALPGRAARVADASADDGETSETSAPATDDAGETAVRTYALGEREASQDDGENDDSDPR